MISFKEFLLEKRMSPRSYVQVLGRLEDRAKIGFEIEIFVPEGSFYHMPPDDMEPDSMHLDEIKSMTDVEVFFNVSSTQETAIDRDYEDWKTQKEDEWVDENWESYEDDDDEPKQRESKARSRALKRVKDKFTWLEWIQSEYKSMYRFIENYELEPTHGWSKTDKHFNKHEPLSAGYYSSFKNTADEIAHHLSILMNTQFRVNAQGYRTWNITHDTSIKDKHGKSDEENQEGVGVEIVSPPQKPSKALADLEKLLSILDERGIETNESTGIHVNISLDEMQDFDALKLVLFMGDKHVLKKFDRLSNSFTNSQLQVVLDGIAAVGYVPKSASDLIRIGREALIGTGKYFSVNLNHMPHYLEFRAAGGENYHKRVNDIRDTVGRWLSAVEIASDPASHRQEYLKKVAQLLRPSEHHEDRKQEMTLAEVVYQADGMFAWQTMEDTFKNSQNPVQRAKAVMVVFLLLSAVLDRFEFTLSQKKEARALLQKAGVSSAEVLAQAKKGSPGTADSVQQSMKALRLM